MCCIIQNQVTHPSLSEKTSKQEQLPESCCSKRLQKNIASVCLAGTLSGGGSLLAGLVTTPATIVAGSLISGSANGLGVYLSWDQEDPQIKVLETKIKNLENQNAIQNKKLLEIEKIIEQFKNKIEPFSNQTT